MTAACRQIGDGVYQMTVPSNPGFSYTFHCEPEDLDDMVSALKAKAWVTADHIDQLKDLIRQHAET